VPASVCDQHCCRSCFLTRLDLLGRRRNLLGFGLGDRRILQFDLVGEIVERSLCAGDAASACATCAS